MSRLRIPRRRAQIASFWTLVLLVWVTTVGILAAVLLPGWWPYWALGAGAALVTPGLVNARWFELGVRAWNKGTRLLTATLRTMSMRITFYLMLTCIGRSGSALGLPFPGGQASMWVRRRGSYGVQLAGKPKAFNSGWLQEFSAFSRQSGNYWMFFFVPFLSVLMLVADEEEDTTPPTSTYTLY